MIPAVPPPNGLEIDLVASRGYRRNGVRVLVGYWIDELGPPNRYI
jgi:hypothetical protein